MGVLNLAKIFKPKSWIFLIAIASVVSFALSASSTSANAPPSRIERSEALPPKLGSFEMIGFAKEIKPSDRDGLPRNHLLSIIEADYNINGGTNFHVTLFKWDNDSAAYADLTKLRKQEGRVSVSSNDAIGTLSVTTDRGTAFFKGATSVVINDRTGNDVPSTVELGKQIAATLPAGEDDLPVLVKHLPNWETAQRKATYAVDADTLREAAPGQPVLDAISFEGGAEAVAANYDQSQLVIIEFTTPQLSIDNDSRIWTKIAELKSQGQPTPTAYRRVGNYSVFVFHAADEKTANALVDQVKYEQVVQWLGEDPHLADRLQKYFTQTSAGVLVAVLKSSGISLLLCLVAGALIGTMMFRHRRTQKAAQYSDAGGSIRLNLDELTGPANTSRLLSSANPSEQNRSNS